MLESIIVCKDYADFLSITLEYNKEHFDNIIIVTSPDDQDTLDLICQYNVSAVVTDKFDEYNKGKAINAGLDHLMYKDWVLITDADMIMPKEFGDILFSIALVDGAIHGTSRLMCPSYDEWLKYKKDPSIAKNWTHQNTSKNVGMGFFQLFKYDNDRRYSEKYDQCGRSDRKFWNSFNNQKIIQGLVPIHLGDDEMGINWHGRVTPKWPSQN